MSNAEQVQRATEIYEELIRIPKNPDGSWFIPAALARKIRALARDTEAPEILAMLKRIQ